MIRSLRSAVLWARGWTVFLLGAPVMLLSSLVLTRTQLFRLVSRWCRHILRAVGIRVEVIGCFPAVGNGPFIIVAPHVNIFDPLVLGSVLPAHIAGVELETHFRWPLYGWIIRRLGHIPISHTSPHRSREALAEAERRIRKCESLVILPEGHRTRTGTRQPFGLWAFRLAARTGTPVLPIAFAGAWERHHVGSWHIVPGVWQVRVLAPIYPSGRDRAAAESLRAAAETSVDIALRAEANGTS